MNRIRLWSLLSALALVIGVAHAQGADFSAWGDNSDGQLGGGSGLDQPTPGQVSGLTSVKAIAAGSQSGYAVWKNGCGGTPGVNDRDRAF